MSRRDASGLPRYSAFAAVLAAAGLPLYIHAPKFFVDTYGVSLSAIGVALLGLRLLDFIQDPALGWLVDHLGAWRSVAASGATIILALAMVALFGISAPFNPLIWFIICIAVLFTAFSFLSILFYARGITKGDMIGPKGHVRLAAWRESGALGGICLAAILPTVFGVWEYGSPMAVFSLIFAVCAAGAGLLMAHEWEGGAPIEPSNFRLLLRDPVLCRLLIVGVFNAAPAAVTASLFLFFVEYRLGSPAGAGPLLLVFFLAAGVTVPIWSRVAQSYGVKRTLLLGMMLSIGSFSFAIGLGTGDVWLFAIVCLISGAGMGADMTLLPALFSQRVETVHGGGGQAFGLWNFCSKFTLALAAATVLPALDYAGFSATHTNGPKVLFILTITYAVIPSILKAIAAAVLAFTPIEEI